MPWLDLVATLGGLVIPGAFDFIKRKFGVKSATPEETLSTLATTSPENIQGFISGTVELLKAKIQNFNRDVIGQPSQWVVDLRASIRPLGVVAAFIILAAFVYGYVFMTADFARMTQIPIVDETLTGIRLSCEAMLTSWFGDRIRLREN